MLPYTIPCWCGQRTVDRLIAMKIALSTDTPLYQITLLASGGYFFPYAGTSAMLDDFFASLEQQTPSAPANEPDPIATSTKLCRCTGNTRLEIKR